MSKERVFVNYVYVYVIVYFKILLLMALFGPDIMALKVQKILHSKMERKKRKEGSGEKAK